MSPQPWPGAKHTRASPPPRDGLGQPNRGEGGERVPRSPARGRHLGLGSARNALPGVPARWGGDEARVGAPPSSRAPRPPRPGRRAARTWAAGRRRHCGSAGGGRGGVRGSAAATLARGAKLGVPAGARPGPACGSGGRGGRKCSGVRALRSHGLSPASPSTGRTAGRGARGRRGGPVKGTARPPRARTHLQVGSWEGRPGAGRALEREPGG